ncbi:response regulator [Pseudonocardia lacus]|uniref:response regulator n=1 Tax=Pseudonocardia lacus TaxID=2835865 RepID=UPI001BDC2A7C|nr:response regulator transcription factor [Pseudonocardia lacus]
MHDRAAPATSTAGQADADVVLCDDHPVFTDALGALLGGHGFVVRAAVHRAGDVVGVVAAHRPLVCVVDRHFTDGDGLDVVPQVRAVSPATRVVLLTADRDPDTARRALAAGASGYLCKTAGVSALISTITRVAGGEVVAAVPAPRAPRAPEHVEAHRLAGYLTPRERDCLAMMVDGLGTAAIAARLGVSATTVRTYAQAVLTKLGVHSRLEAASFAVRHSLLDTSA